MSLNVCIYNVLAPVAPPLRYTGQLERMSRIPTALADQVDPMLFLDVVGVQESMVESQHAVLSAGMQRAGFVHETPQLQGKLRDLKLVNGGIVLFSRHPIIQHRRHVFTNSCVFSDCQAAKGCVYARIRKNERDDFHVFLIHTQAWSTPRACEVRQQQFHEVRTFMNSLSLPDDARVVVMGDFNIDRYSARDEWCLTQKHLHVRAMPIHPRSHPFSSDPSTNQLMGIDDDVAYSSDAYPGGCYELYQRTLRCPCCPQEWLDYVTVSDDHAAVNRKRSWMRVVPIKAAEPFMAQLTVSMRRSIRDLSDHYPVVARLVFGGASVDDNEREWDEVTPWLPPPIPDHSTSPVLFILACSITALILLTVLVLVLRRL
jgi:endonuclease/exonuclease/phosphatase family metal-dependent hydrolase